MSTKVNDININIPPPDYVEIHDNLAIPKGVNSEEQKAKLLKGIATNSVVNKLHLIKLANVNGTLPFNDIDLTKNELFKVRNFTDLCKLDTKALEYDVDDFAYCKNLGQPLNRMITLRRYPYPCMDNIWDIEAQSEPDIARMVTFFNQEVNKMDELLSFSYAMKWKTLTAEMEQATMQGDQSGVPASLKTAMKFFDPIMANDVLRGENSRMMDPKFDQNKVYGPVDSINETNIREVGLEFNKEFEIQFDYVMRSINGRTVEYAMKDIIANILACTHNNAKFWPGARYWIGERPSKFYEQFKYMNSDKMDTILTGATENLKSAIKTFSGGGKTGAIETLKGVLQNGLSMAMGKILDKVGRPGILTMNSLLSGEPTGFWHLTIGNPINPIMCIGNLILTGVDFSFPTDSLSYGDFPTKLQVKVKLKPGQPKDKAGIEMMFNHGKQRIYYAPKKVTKTHSQDFSRKARRFFSNEADETGKGQQPKTTTDSKGNTKVLTRETKMLNGKGIPVKVKELVMEQNSGNNIHNMFNEAFDFIAEGVVSTTETVKNTPDMMTTDKNKFISVQKPTLNIKQLNVNPDFIT